MIFTEKVPPEVLRRDLNDEMKVLRQGVLGMWGNTEEKMKTIVEGGYKEAFRRDALK